MSPKSPRIRGSNQNVQASTSATKLYSPRAPYNKSVINTQIRKRRSSGYGNKKNASFTDKAGKTNKLLAQIPKALLLTPCSSENSLTASTGSSSDAPSYTVQPKASPAKPAGGDKQLATLPPYLTLKRQQTAAMLNFRARKSLSQMDFKEARRSGNYQLVAHVPSANALVPSVEKTCDALSIKNENLTKMLLQDAALLCKAGDGNVRFVVSGGEQDVRVASLRIFNTIMLQAWRRRREEVRSLNDQLEDFKRSFVKNRNQLHVYNSLFSVEKRRNETLNDQLKQSYRDNAKVKLSYDELNMLLTQTTQEKQKLAQDIAVKEMDIENLQQLLQKTQNELFRTTNQQRQQLEELTDTQRQYQDNEFEKQELLNELEILKIELTLKQQNLDQVRDKLLATNAQLSLEAAQLQQQKSAAEQQYSELLAKNKALELALQQNEEQLHTLQQYLADTVGQRIRQCLGQRQAYQQATFRMLHFVAYCMMPGSPQPPVPINTLPHMMSKLRSFINTHFRGSDAKPQLEDKTIVVKNDAIESN